MKREECTVGAQVYTTDGLEYLYEVTALPDEEGMVAVKKLYKSSYQAEPLHLDDIFLYDPRIVQEAAEEMQANIDAATNAFETAFKALEKIKEYRNKDGVHIGRYELKELGLISLKELEQTIEYGGWSSSSIWC